MSDDKRHKCCRLCLAPDSECISILNSYAADKEPLTTKIYNCVHIKINSTDRLSLRICHACISYLNSWQSFKNRCVASQNKQQIWLDSNKQQQHDTTLGQQQDQLTTTTAATTADELNDQSALTSSILDGISSLKKRKSLTVYPLPAVQIKDEPYDSDEVDANRHGQQQQQQDDCDDIVDPTMFLERTEEEGEEPLDGTVYGYANSQQMSLQQQLPLSTLPQHVPMITKTTTPLTDPVKQASCRACNLKFSTRANARRHERTLHPNLFELSTSTPFNTPVTKPTPAFAAALAAHGNAGPLVPVPATSIKSLSSTPKYRQQVVNAFAKKEFGGYDYESPEKYQHLLTDEKIIFLEQNEQFLQQYQNMTCRCCNKFFTTYKNFMAHMRKKYPTLPRNLCFNCLKLNDSKSLFIAHLKRRNCINLFKVLHALMSKNSDFAAAVKATAAAVPEKLRAKDLLVNKMYECKLCPKHFRLKLEFRTHVYDEHSDAQQKDATPTACPFCALEIEDPVERKRHYNNMECIVTLRCLTCEAKFDNHQKFIDHVYEKHLADIAETGTQHLQQPMMHLPALNSADDNSPGKKNSAGGASSADESRSSHSAAAPAPKSQYHSRMPQACPICGQQYNNYNNVLRHMESKHPDQLPKTYKCVKCGTGFPRLSNLREHMVSMHNGDKSRQSGFEYIVNPETLKGSESGGGGGNTSSNAYTGRYDYVMKDLLSITNGGTTVEDDNDGEYEQQQQQQQQPPTAKRIRLENTSSGGTTAVAKECPICDAVFSNNIGLSNHMRSHTAAAQSTQAAIAAARAKTPNSLTITPTTSLKQQQHAAATNNPQYVAAQQQAVFKRSLEQAADRRFRRMRCRMCQRRFSSKKSYRFHMLNDHQIRNVQFIKCKLCDAEFAYEKGLKVHMFKIHNTLLRDEMIVKQYECDICSTIYRSEQQLLQHKRTTHGQDVDMDTNSGVSTPVSGSGGQADNSNAGGSGIGPLYWYQCKYCPSNFNTNKKLAIHINSHDEFDSNDYSCKDCGNVYSGRKSLWVHRYKKHPQIAEPSECVLCKKVFFDSQMLENHIPTCNRKPITATGAHSDANQIYRHKTGDDEDENSNEMMNDVPKFNIPEVACTICGARFTDQDLFSKHIQMHEQELYTDNPLASMFDTGPADPNQFYLDCVNDMGAFACDLCSKTFTQMTALKVHRKWHFRGDSKQNPTEAVEAMKQYNQQTSSSIQNNQPRQLGLQAVGLVPRNMLPSKSQKRKRELKCEYCPSTFISNNNLRRHMYELHKDEVTNLPQPPPIDVDDELHCRRCSLKFETKREWIEHKVADARITRPFGPFQWGCDLCGAYVSRKEKLINHIQNHLKDSVIMKVDLQKPTENTQKQLRSSMNDTTSSTTQQIPQPKMEIKSEADEETTTMAAEAAAAAQVSNNNDNDNSDMQNGEYEGNDGEEEEEVEGEDNEAEADEDNGQESNNDTDDSEDEDSDDDDNDNDSSSSQSEAEEEDNSNRTVPPLTIKRKIAENIDESADEEDDDDDNDGDNDDDDDDNENVENADPNDLIEEVEEDDMEYEVDEDHDDHDDSRSSAGDNNRSTAAIEKNNQQHNRRFACDLCQVFFDSQQELQKHVKMHFLNGPGSVSLTEMKPRPVSKSNSTSSSGPDALTVSSS